MGGRGLRVISRSFDSGGRLAWRFAWAAADVFGGGRDFRGCFDGLRDGGEHSATGDGTERPGYWSRVPGTRQPVPHQRILRREETGAGDRHVVGFYGDDHGAGAGFGRLAD